MTEQFIPVQSKRYEIKFEDGQQYVAYAYELEDLLLMIDKNIEAHGECIECYEVELGNKWIADKYTRIW